MDPRWESVVRRLLPDLVNIWRPQLDHLYSACLVTIEEYQSLSRLLPFDQCKKLLIEILPRKGPKAYETFLEVLSKTEGQEFIAEMLEKAAGKRIDVSTSLAVSTIRASTKEKIAVLASWDAYPYRKKSKYRSDWESFVRPLLQELADVWTPDLDELYAALRVDKNDLPDSLSRFELCETLLIDILPQRGRRAYGTFLAMLPRSKEMKFIVQVLEDWKESFLNKEFSFLRVDLRWMQVVQVLLPDLVKIWRPHLQRFYDSRILSKDEYDTLLGLPRFEQCKKLLIQILPFKGPGCYNAFLNVLLETEGEDSVVVNMLRRRKEERRFKFDAKPMDRRWLLIREPLYSKVVAAWNYRGFVLNSLFENGLISFKEYESLLRDREEVQNEYDRGLISPEDLDSRILEGECKKLLIDLLPKKGSSSFGDFLSVLKDRKAEQYHAWDLLHSAASDVAYYVSSSEEAATATHTASPSAKDAVLQGEESSTTFSLGFHNMTLSFTRTKTVEEEIDESGGKLESDFFSLTIPRGAVMGNPVKIGFTIYEYQPEASEGVEEDCYITDILVLHPRGTCFARNVTVSFNLKTVIFSKNQGSTLLYDDEEETRLFLPSPVRPVESMVFDNMTAILNPSRLDINTKHFCKFFACFRRCAGHCYRTLAFGRWTKGESLHLQTATIDLHFTSTRRKYVDYVEKCNRGMPVLLKDNATIYFSKKECSDRLNIEVNKISYGWELQSSAPMSIEKEELTRAKKHLSKFCTRFFKLKKMEKGAEKPWLEIRLTDEEKTDCILLLDEYASLHTPPSSVSSSERRRSLMEPSKRDAELNRFPTKKELLDVSQEILDRWKFVARYLDVEEKNVIAASADAKGDVREQAYQMLSIWKECKGDAATVEELCKALESVSLKATANKVFRYSSFFE